MPQITLFSSKCGKRNVQVTLQQNEVCFFMVCFHNIKMHFYLCDRTGKLTRGHPIIRQKYIPQTNKLRLKSSRRKQSSSPGGRFEKDVSWFQGSFRRFQKAFNEDSGLFRRCFKGILGAFEAVLVEVPEGFQGDSCETP